MTSDPSWLAPAIMAGVISYLIHSTLVLSTVWLLVKCRRTQSHAFEESMWKLAAVLGLFTVPLQMFIGWPVPWEIALAHHTSTTVDLTRPHPLAFKGAQPVAASEDHVASEVRSEPLSTDVAAGFETVGDKRNTDNKDDVRFAIPTLHPKDSEEQIGKATAAQAIRERLALSPSLSTGIYKRPLSDSVLRSAVLLSAYMTAGCVLLIVRFTMLWHRLAEAREIDSGPARQILKELQRKHAGGRFVRLLSSDRCMEPVAFGLIRWTIVLPRDFVQRLKHDELRALLAHELAHLVRGDLWWVWIGHLICTCLPFQPLNFLARRRWSLATEYSCDEWALQHGVTGLSLARCLAKIAQWKLDGDEPPFVLAAGGSKSTLICRVERLMDPPSGCDVWTTPQRRRRFRLTACVVVAVFSAVAPRACLPSGSAADRDTHGETGGETRSGDDQPLGPDLMLLDDELRQLDADLVCLDAVLNRFPPDHLHHQFRAVLEERAERIRECRRRIDFSSAKEFHQ